MHDVVMNVGECRIIARFTEARMIRSDDSKAIRPRFGKIKPVDRTRAVEQHQRIAFSGSMDDGLDAVDREFFPYESTHRYSSKNHLRLHGVGWRAFRT